MTVYFAVPNDIDATPSGGNIYDRRVIDGLGADELTVAGSWPHPSPADLERLDQALSLLPDQATVVVDGLVGSAAPAVLARHQQLRLILLMHMPLSTPEEEQALRATRAVVTTSQWTRRLLISLYAYRSDRVHVAEPGVDAAAVHPATAAGSRLVCVAAVTPGKGHDILVDALATLDDLEWTLDCVGPLDRDPAFVDAVGKQINAAGLSDRIVLCGVRTRWDGDLLCHASRSETYGMVIAEALARGMPVVATDVGGVPEALGRGGLLVPPDDPASFARAVRAWLTDPHVRTDLRTAALARRATLTGWDETVRRFAAAL
ncbi:MAG: glycosyltransferase family 4 protein [Hamadaea sp.]|uniref:glycosyltransferase family 4 protein n=1 Tax=Hamadaea sp. TaxID=2024425 RepID=UPI0017909B3A|nr:glycosyltransferase family 4 protein [Hamadaea sp.]NUR72167.1 glycosyltransferase family 4 protein [Hamadaea sp.]NUT22734.1 glycosyltransferase family 4 protein [Hamadaea sp.]